MNINELFLALAGFNTELDDLPDGSADSSRNSAAAVALAQKAAAFGRGVAAIRVATSRSQEHPVCDVLRERVECELLEQLVSVESQTLARLRVHPPSSSAGVLLVVADVLAQTVDVWEPRLRFAMDCLEKLTLPRAQQVVVVEQAGLAQSGDPQIWALTEHCLSALDRCWAADMCTELSQCGGRFDMRELVQHPKIRDPDQLLEAYFAMKRLGESARTDSRVLRRMFEVIDANQALFDALTFPFSAVQLNNALTAVHANVNRAVREALLRSERVVELLRAIREVALLGSAEIVLRAEDNVSMRDILEEYQEQYDTDVVQYDETTNWISISRDDLSLFVVNDQQWRVIRSISMWLWHIVTTLSGLRVGGGTLTHAYRLLFQSIWSDCQRSIEDMFEHLNSVIDSDKSMSICAALDAGIADLVSRLMLDQAVYRAAMRTALERCTSNDPLPLTELVGALEGDTSHTIDLMPFRRFASIYSFR